jgi:beta-mannosidase
MMYAQKGHAPVANAIQEAELRHNVRRLSHHPSIVLFDGCNECTVVTSDPESETAVYASFVMTTVANEDKSRIVWPSCPADGWSAGVHKLTGLPNGEALLTPDTTTARCTTVPGRQCIEIHRPKWKGTGDGFPTVNSVGSLKPTLGPMVGPHLYGGLFPSEIPLNLTQSDHIGPQWPSLFSSESPGGTCFSSFESMSPTLAPEHWGVHGGNGSGKQVMAQRNYANDNFIAVMFGNRTLGQLSKTGVEAFKAQLYWSMIAQALVIKQNIEQTRSINRFGTMVWQLNEIWPTGGWGSVEYGNPLFPGQVIGGRWKPLQHMFEASIFADVMASCDGASGLCYVKNDGVRPFSGTLWLNITNFATSQVSSSYRVVRAHLFHFL